MLRRNVILGPLVIGLAGLTAYGQNATYNPPYSTVGSLQSVGLVGRSDPLLSLGRVGGLTTGRYDQQGLPQRAGGFGMDGPGRGYRPGSTRPRGILDPRAGLPGYTGGSSRIPSNMEFRPRSTNPRAGYESNRYQSYRTRHQLARGAIGASSVRDTGVLADWRVVLSNRARYMTPIERFHARANLLSPKSELGQILSTTDVALYDATPLTPPSAPEPPADTVTIGLDKAGDKLRAYDNAMFERLNNKHQEYRNDALRFFKEKNWIGARACLDTCRSLDRKSAWPLALDTLVALEMREHGRAFNSLLGAVTRARTLDDLQLKKIELYGDSRNFEKILDEVNFLASQDESGKVQAGRLLLAYCAWFNGDIATAAAEAQTAAKSMSASESLADASKDVQRFAAQLKPLAAKPTGPQS